MSRLNIINRKMENIKPEKDAIIIIQNSDNFVQKTEQLGTISSEATIVCNLQRRRHGKVYIKESLSSDMLYVIVGAAAVKEDIPDIALTIHKELEKLSINGRKTYMEAIVGDDNDLILQTMLTLGADITLYKGDCAKDSKDAEVIARLTEYTDRKAAEEEKLFRSTAKSPFPAAETDMIVPDEHQLAAAAEFTNAELYITDECRYSLDDIGTKIANNVLVVGSVGTGKTRNIVTPNLGEAVGSSFNCDPKGQLYKQYGDYLRAKGYAVKLIDFTHPERSEGYNPMAYIRSTQDIDRISAVITNAKKSEGTHADPFWDNMNITLLNALIAYLFETGAEYKDFGAILELVREGGRDNDGDESDTPLERRFKEHYNKYPDSWAYEQFVLVNNNPNKTFNCVLGTLASKLSKLDTPELRDMMAKESIDFTEAAMKKTAVFVTVSDNDRTLDDLVNIFFSQALSELCDFADNRCENGRLPIPVRFILDDFATNCRIEEFPRMISSFRSRAISVMLMIQSESQLEHGYGRDGNTIIANCDTYVYLGGNDVPTAEKVAKRCDIPFEEVSSMPIGSCIVFRRGSRPVRTTLSDPEGIIREMTRYRKKGGEYVTSTC